MTELHGIPRCERFRECAPTMKLPELVIVENFFESEHPLVAWKFCGTRVSNLNEKS